MKIALTFDLDHGMRLHKTCSVGFSCFPFLLEDSRGLSWSHVVELADQALYIAKHSGRNAWIGLYGTEQADPESLVRHLAHGAAFGIETGRLKKISNKDGQPPSMSLH